jgi:2'-5' RNA ligase
MRLFVALEVPDGWREAARATTESVARASGVRLRAVDPALMHLTLRFLGDVPDAAVPQLVEALAGTVPPVDVALELAPAGTFGPPARTQVVWLGVGGELDALQALAARVETAVRAAGLPPEDRPLRAHLTLARLGRQLDAAERRAVAEAVHHLEAPPPLTFRAREAVLVRSYLGNPQPRYEVIARFPDSKA